MIRPLSIALSIFFVITNCLGQDPVATATPNSADTQYQAAVTQLEREKRIAELEHDIAVAKKGTRDTAPQVVVKPNSGSLSISEEDIAREIIVYRELAKVNAKVAGLVRKSMPQNSTLVVFDSTGYADWTFYRRSLPLFKIVIADLAADYCQVATTSEDKMFESTAVGAASAIASATNVVGQIADLISYFRTETAMTGKAVTIGEDAIVADLYPRLAGPDLTVFYPKSFPLDLPVLCGQRTQRRSCCTSEKEAECSESRTVYCSEIANALDDLYRARRAAYAAKKESVELKRLDKYFSDFLQLFTEPAAGSTDTALRKYINAEQYAALGSRDNLYYLEIKSVKAVGTTRIRKNLFFLTDKLDYSGGVILQWTLFDKQGAVRGGGVETSFDGFTRPKDLRTPSPRP